MKIKQFPLSVKFILLYTFFADFVSIVMLTFMPIYFSTYLGLATAGLLLALNIGIGFFIKLYSGYFVDLFGSQKAMRIGEVIRFGSLVAIAAVNTELFHSPLLTFIFMIVLNMASSLTGPASHSLLINSSISEHRKYVFAFAYWMYNISIALGALIGAWLFKENMVVLVLLLSVLSLINFIVASFFVKDTQISKEKAVEKIHFKNIVVNYKNTLKNRTFLYYILTVVFIITMDMQLINYVSVRLDSYLDIQKLFIWSVDGVKILGILRVENAILVLFCTALVMRMFKKYKDKNTLRVGVILFGLGTVLLIVSNNPYLLLVAMLISTMGELASSPIQEALLGDIAPEEAMGSHIAVISVAQSVAMLMASLFITLGALTSSWVVALIIVLFTIVTLILHNSIYKRI